MLFYDLAENALANYERLVAAADAVGACTKKWRIDAQGRVSDPKYHAGAGHLVKRSATFFDRHHAFPYLALNVDAPMARSDSALFVFLPDRLLVKERGVIGAVSYENLRASARDGRFIEEESVPSDAQVVGRTWRYVNKRGGPDRRFKYNRQLPVCAYNELDLESDSGLRARFSLSRAGAAQALSAWLNSQRA
ncbi:hypothetical protein [Chiayiivirga flava]|uniref:Uncharacterized protein n=1 Tax=Chiayiivirga flava TaxID=659595 RepID=A0A7W8D6A6_9GAMM|nr:hypothetical protein [Chiayiivirga flava]MBB5208317.1 hypothetical protein [Chiayiivirga flava]